MTDRASIVERDIDVDDDDDGGDALFVDHGVPVKFCFHKSVTQGRGRITRDVERHGGEIVAHEHHANVLLVDEQEDIALFRRRYYSSTERYRLELYVEPRRFVRTCIRAGVYRHDRPVKQGMPGRAPGKGTGRVRTPFTEQDRNHLAYYLATRFPTRDGRMGNSAYKDLERLAQTQDRNWAWARRHTWHSWREHYKMNPDMMDVRIEHHIQRLRPVGHHFGHDPRSHARMDLREEDEEDDDGEDGEEQEQERRDRERRQQVRPVVARERQPGRAARDLVALDDDNEVIIVEPPRAKRNRVLPDARPQPDSRETRAKRVRVAEAMTNEGRTSGGEESSILEGSDLFGDRTYENENRFNFDDMEQPEFPPPLSPRASPMPGQDGPPPSTQATLIASPRSPEKEHAPALSPANAAEVPPRPATPSSPERTLVMTQERVVVHRARVRGASAQPGPSMPRETRAAGADAPYRNTRGQSRPVRQPQPEPELRVLRQRKDRGRRGKGKAKEEALALIQMEAQVEEGQEEEHAEEDVGPVSGTVGETFEDEMAVEGLLEAGDKEKEEDEHGEDSEGDEDEDIVPDLPPYQEVEVEEEPSDSDDAEIHASLVRGAVGEGSAGSGDEPGGSEDDEDADRIERMAGMSLHVAPAPSPVRARVTRSMAAAGFPSPGTKARAVVDRFREEERRAPYAPPTGTRAAKARRRRG